MKQYNYAIVHSGQSISDSKTHSFVSYWGFRQSLVDLFVFESYHRENIIGDIPTQTYMQNLKENTPDCVACFVDQYSTPNPWVTKVFMSSIVVWTSEKKDEE